MHRTTVYLPDALRARVKRVAAERGISEAELIRSAIDEYTERVCPRPTLPLFDSKKGNLAGRVDELLAEGFGRD